MPWKEETKMSIKEKFIAAALEKKVAFADLCNVFKISRVCGYKWLKRYQEMGQEGLKEQSRRPHSSPYKTCNTLEKQILSVREQHPAWGARKIYAYLTHRGVLSLPDPSTITRILHRYEKVSREESQKRQAFIRFEYEEPNQLWQMDFKGHFAMSTGRCNPLTILDDCTRFSLILRACENQQESVVKSALIDAFREYGMPEKMTMDNGAPWGNGSTVNGYSRLEIWLICLGIHVSHSRPFHPQTQGKDERFHRSLKEELLKRKQFTDLIEAQRCFDEWRQCYNEERPHEALGMHPPKSKYKTSPRQYPEKAPKIEYEMGAIVRRVSNKGTIIYEGEKYYISESMKGLPVKLVEEKQKDIVEVYLCTKRVKEIDLINKVVLKKIL